MAQLVHTHYLSRATRPLSRVTASAYGYNRDDKHGFRAAGYDAACKLLGVEV